jgi:hypothetical protein
MLLFGFSNEKEFERAEFANFLDCFFRGILCLVVTKG